ncbi:hypothetical protein GOB82_08000 [Acetobacter farinalis]|nr:hypothetical protein [Acetobacter farinalis]
MIHAPNQLKGNGITEQLSKPGGFSNPPDDVIRKIQDYREKITSSNRSEEEIQRLTDEADQSIKEMDKTL